MGLFRYRKEASYVNVIIMSDNHNNPKDTVLYHTHVPSPSHKLLGKELLMALSLYESLDVFLVRLSNNFENLTQIRHIELQYHLT